MSTLTTNREARLIRKAQAGSSSAFEELLQAHEFILASIADRFPHRPTADRQDLLQEARIGFVTAVESFDPRRGARLGTNVYREASKCVAEAVSTGGAIAVPGRTLRRYLAAWADADTYEDALKVATSGAHPMGLDTFAAVHESLHGVMSMDAARSGEGPDEGHSHHDTIAAPVLDTLHTDAAYALVNALPLEMREVIALAFGLLGEDALIDADIAPRLGLSRQKVQRLRNAAMERMSTVATAGPRTTS